MADDRTYKPTMYTIDDDTKRMIDALALRHKLGSASAVVRFCVSNQWHSDFPKALKEQLTEAQS